MKYLIIAFFYIISYSLDAQTTPKAKDSIEVYLAIDARGNLFDTELPFWMVANTFGGVGNTTQGYAGASSRIEYALNERSTITAGISAFYRDGVSQQLQRNEVYIQYERPAWRIVLGSKNPETENTFLSTTNENIILSGNARSLPGVLLETTKPFRILDKLHLDMGIGHYALNDEQRFVQDARVHYKRFYATYTINSAHSFKAGIQHFAQWGGTSPTIGEQPDGFADFGRIFLGSEGGDSAFEGDQLNALGNHLGSIDFQYNYRTERGNLSVYHLHLFEDGSGTRFANFPDGVWGAKYQFKQYRDLILNYEYVDTRNQSGSRGRSARDNYFSNSVYRSGWTYEGAILGLPFFELNQETGLGISNNRVVAHHLAGSIKPSSRISLVGKLTYLVRKGTFAAPIIPNERFLLAFGQIDYKVWSGLMSLQGGYDMTNLDTDNFGISLGYKYMLN